MDVYNHLTYPMRPDSLRIRGLMREHYGQKIQDVIFVKHDLRYGLELMIKALVQQPPKEDEDRFIFLLGVPDKKMMDDIDRYVFSRVDVISRMLNIHCGDTPRIVVYEDNHTYISERDNNSIRIVKFIYEPTPHTPNQMNLIQELVLDKLQAVLGGDGNPDLYKQVEEAETLRKSVEIIESSKKEAKTVLKKILKRQKKAWRQAKTKMDEMLLTNFREPHLNENQRYNAYADWYHDIYHIPAILNPMVRPFVRLNPHLALLRTVILGYNAETKGVEFSAMEPEERVRLVSVQVGIDETQRVIAVTTKEIEAIMKRSQEKKIKS
jgi:hypothetical protein